MAIFNGVESMERTSMTPEFRSIRSMGFDNWGAFGRESGDTLRSVEGSYKLEHLE